MIPVRSATNYVVECLGAGWQLAAQPASPFAEPEPQLLRELDAWPWEAAQVPGTVASSRRAGGTWSLDSAPEDFDRSEFWYRRRFACPPAQAGESLWLRFDGLATLADVWLNGRHLLRSENMFVASEVNVTNALLPDNELVIRFASVASAAEVKRPRPRFRTRLVDRQQLRWIRTTLLGRMPGWSPPAAAVGPWREVWLERRRGFSIDECQLRAAVKGDIGEVELRLTLALGSTPIEAATLEVGGVRQPLQIQTGERCIVEGRLTLPQPALWWPRPYGEQPLYTPKVELRDRDSSYLLELEPVAFRSLSRPSEADVFSIFVNGVEVRAFGACWTPPDIVSLNDPRAAIAAVQQARDAGMNLLRVGGTMVYECDAFYRECDRCGIMVWQDFMFANCDYPRDDPKFAASVQLEANQLLQRLAHHPCLTVLCGSSEVEQQISMLGLPREQWKPPLFETDLRELCQRRVAEVPYLASTPSGGALPFQANAGVTHYYGVGAYLRPLEDARRAEVRFAAECLAFANVPEQSTIDELMGDVRAPFHDPRWKQRVPRDNGASWDFDDVRDHYVQTLFGVDPMRLRYQDVERALALARVASGEVMLRTLLEWRRQASTCRGALIWLYRDLWPGAGWGVVDALGRPKAAYYYVKRALRPRTILISDEGVNGARLEVVNSGPEALHGLVELTLWRSGHVKVAEGTTQLTAPRFGNVSVDAATLLEHFIDLTHAYRFGPPAYDVAVARLYEAETRTLLGEASYFPSGMAQPRVEDLGLEAKLHARGEQWRLQLTTTRFAQAVAVEVAGFVPDDSYFDLPPGTEKWVALTAEHSASRAPRGVVRALNLQSPVRIVPAAQGD